MASYSAGPGRAGSGPWFSLGRHAVASFAFEADTLLRHVRFGKDQAELTTRTYAGHVALYLRWCIKTSFHLVRRR